MTEVRAPGHVGEIGRWYLALSCPACDKDGPVEHPSLITEWTCVCGAQIRVDARGVGEGRRGP